jgi:hypothetical protein
MDILFEEMDSTGFATACDGPRVVGPVGRRWQLGDRVNTVKRWPDRFVGFLGIDLENITESLAETCAFIGQPGVVGISIEPGSSKTPGTPTIRRSCRSTRRVLNGTCRSPSRFPDC